MQKPTLKLQIFRDIHSKFKNPPWLGFLVLGMLIGLEERYINWKTKMTVDKAIKDYNKALKICIENLNIVSICDGTHNEES